MGDVTKDPRLSVTELSGIVATYPCAMLTPSVNSRRKLLAEVSSSVNVTKDSLVMGSSVLTRDFYGKNSGNFPEPSRALAKEIEKINTVCTAPFSKCQTNLNVTVKG